MKSQRWPFRILLSLYLLAGAAASSAQEPDREALRQMILQRMGLTAPAPTIPVAQRPAQVALTEAALAQQVAAWRPVNGPFAVERFRDGFSIEGESVLDPEGSIVLSAVDNATGEATYLMEGLPGQYVIKMMRHGAGPAVTIGSANRRNGQWSVETATGVRVFGSRFNLTPRGFMVARDNALFRYIAGTGLRSFSLPETHALAAHQNGNVGGTGWVLLEKRRSTKDSEGGIMARAGLGELMGAVNGLGAALGVSKSDSDFALYQIESRKLVPLGISLSDKQVSILSQCHQKNRWVAMCDQMDSVDSLYLQDGSPNRSHYYWRLSWFNTSRGAVAVVMEDGVTKILAINLGTDQRATVFQRTLGIGDWSSTQLPDGRIQIKARMGFDGAVNDDVAGVFTTAAVSAPL